MQGFACRTSNTQHGSQPQERRMISAAPLHPISHVLNHPTPACYMHN